jgi:hypothetical protein
MMLRRHLFIFAVFEARHSFRVIPVHFEKTLQGWMTEDTTSSEQLPNTLARPE